MLLLNMIHDARDFNRESHVRIANYNLNENEMNQEES